MTKQPPYTPFGAPPDSVLRNFTDDRRTAITATSATPEADLARFLAIKSGKMRKVGMDEKVDLAAANARGEVPQFHVVKQASLDKFEEIMTGAAEDDVLKGGMDGIAERLRRTLMPTQEAAAMAAGQDLVDIVSGLPHDRRAPVIKQAFDKVERADRRKRLASARAHHVEAKANLKRATENVEQKKRRLAAMQHIEAISAAPVLQRLIETGFHKCVAALRDKSCILAGVPEWMELEREITNHDDKPDVHSFVVQHDWAQAFEKATDFTSGEYRLPYHACVFEFRISGSRVCFSIDAENDGTPTFSGLYIETPVGWAISQISTWQNGHWCGSTKLGASILTLCAEQVRAICIALSAKVAEKTIVRAPHRLNIKRVAAGKPPVLDYHIIDLAHRVRYAKRLPEPGDIQVEHARRRLHFVRGHWRYYPNHRIFVEWHLRGDPDLGFIDKEYRL